MGNCLIVRKSGGVSKLKFTSLIAFNGDNNKTYTETPKEDCYIIVAINTWQVNITASGLTSILDVKNNTGAYGAGTGMKVYQAKKGIKWSIVGVTGLDIIKAEFE